MKTAYVVGYSNGFDWYFTPEAQEKEYQKEVEETKNIWAYHVIKFTYEYDESLSNEEVTDLIDVYFNSDEFDEKYPKWSNLYLRDLVKEMEDDYQDLKKENEELRIKLKELKVENDA
jgi:hypothetical protein